MSKKIVKQFVVYAVAWKADPRPPLGPTMWQNGVPIWVFMKDFNDRTREIWQKYGDVKVPALVRVYIDKSFDFDILPPVTSHLILSMAGVTKWSNEPNKKKIGKITMAKIKEIAEMKKSVMNTDDEEAIMKSIIGTAKTLGVDVV